MAGLGAGDWDVVNASGFEPRVRFEASDDEEKGTSEPVGDCIKVNSALVARNFKRRLAKAKTEMVGKKSAHAAVLRAQFEKARLVAAPAAEFEFGAGVAPIPSLTRISLFLEGLVTSTAGGQFLSVFGNNPSSAIDWSSCSGLFQMYRVLGFTITFLPANRYNKVTTICTPGYVTVDWENSTALATAAEAVSLAEGLKFVTLEDPWEHKVVLPTEYPYNQWVDTSSPSSLAYMKFYFDYLSASTTYGRYVLKYDCEFLGRT
jgi:hypothetical protein